MSREKVVCLVSGGIDSPVSMVLAAKHFEVLPLHFCLYPYTCEDSFLVAMRTLEDIRKKVSFEKVVVYSWSKVLRKIMNSQDKSFACLECRRSMFHVAELVCEREGATGIVTGESLGQKASQTLSNLWATSSGIRFPILRPLLGMDKLDIERLSKKEDIWHEVHSGCCYATPKYPRTRASPEQVNSLLKDIKLEDLVRKQLDEIFEVRTFREDFKGYLESLV